MASGRLANRIERLVREWERRHLAEREPVPIRIIEHAAGDPAAEAELAACYGPWRPGDPVRIVEVVKAYAPD